MQSVIRHTFIAVKEVYIGHEHKRNMGFPALMSRMITRSIQSGETSDTALHSRITVEQTAKLMIELYRLTIPMWLALIALLLAVMMLK